jgi:hypothetical protein
MDAVASAVRNHGEQLPAVRVSGGAGITTAQLWRQVAALAGGTRAGLPAAATVRPPLLRPVPASMATAGWLIALAAVIAVGVAAAVRWPEAAAALAFRAGHAAGAAWATLKGFGAWLLDNFRRMLE